MKLTESFIFKAVVSALLTLGAFAFFAFLYPYHLHYHEDLQLFLLTTDYASQVLAEPGGMALYLGRFVIQFFYYSTLGAAILALLLLACQLLTWKVLPRRTTATYGLSVLPALLIWAFLCNEDAMPAALVAMIATELAAWGVISVKSLWPKIALWLVGIPVLYFLFGPLALVFTLIVAIDYVRTEARGTFRTAVIGGAIGVTVLCPLLAQYVYAYPLDRLVKGIAYVRHPLQDVSLAWIAALTVSAMQLLSLMFTQEPRKHARTIRFAIITAALAFLTGATIIHFDTDFKKENIFAYHHLASQQKWKEIIKRAEANPPADQITTIYTNLALAATGKLNERLLEFPQHGVDGLMAPIGDSFFPVFATSEVFWQTGMLKPAMHYIYEIQQSIPDCQMSAQCTRRLAETYIANGDSALAKKYLTTLSNSLFYKDWAKKRLKMLDKESNSYTAVADKTFTTDMFIDQTDPEKMLEVLVADRPQNNMAYDYLIAWLLLARDIEPLPDVVSPVPSGTPMPTLLQQALALQWAHDHTSWEGLPWSLSDEVKGQFIDFSNTYREGMPVAALPVNLKNTYWAYYFND